MTTYSLVFSKIAIKQLKKIKPSGLLNNVKKLLNIIKNNPYENPPKLEKLVCLKNVYSRRINIKHRLVYKIDENNKIIYILSLWSHYEDLEI